jgi:PleD family two-component response regulator
VSQLGFDIATQNTGYRLDRLSVLVVDDNCHMILLIGEILRGLGIRQAAKFTDPADAFKELAEVSLDLIICDHVMDPLSGVEFVQILRTGKDNPNPFVPVIMVTGYGDVATVTSARDAGVTEFLIKPITAKALYLRVLEAINKPRPFVRSHSFFGPDRRRQVLPFEGPDRRLQAPMEIQDSDHVARLYPINPHD